MDTPDKASDRAPPVTLEPPNNATPPRRPSGVRLFSPDSCATEDALGHGEILAPAAELVAHPDCGSPMTIGVFGGPGSGKSSALAWLAARVASLAGDAHPGASASTQSAVFFRVAGSDIAENPYCAIADALQMALSEATTASSASSSLVVEALHAVVDPHEAARDAADRLDATRSRLDAERRALDDLEARKVRLLDSLLYENAGSSIDAFIRTRRGAIESRLQALGFENDPVAAFKELSREAAERSSALATASGFLRAIWAYTGQTALLVLAVLMVVLAEACRIGVENSDIWIGSLRGLGDQARPVADFAEAHIAWLESLRSVAWPLAALFVAVNLWRATRFVSLVARGGRLLAADLATRRGQLEISVAHQTRRVDSLSRDFEQYADAAERARARAERTSMTPSPHATLAPAPENATMRARAFLDHVADAVKRGDANAPRRLVAMIDGLEALPPEAAAAAVRESSRILGREGIVTLLAVDPQRLSGVAVSRAAAAEFFDRHFNVAINLPDTRESSTALTAYARSLLVGAAAAPAAAARMSIAAPLAPVEAELVAALAPLAAATPRAAKRFVNLYRLARVRSADPAALALALALDSGATSAELAAVGAAMDAGPDDAPLAFAPEQERLGFALAAVNKARSAPLTIADARRAWSIARDYRMPL